MSDLTDAIRSRGKLIGTLVSIASPALSESLSKSGLDWLFFDLEHSVMTLFDVQTMIQAMHWDCLAFIRLEEPCPVYVKKALDTGCAGIVVPQVNSPELARSIVAAGKFPPMGARSVGLGRCVGYGSTLAEGIRTENERTSIIVQIENIDAVRSVRQIAEIEGVDALFIGPYALSGSLGIPGNIEDAQVQDAIDRVIEAGKAENKPIGIFVGSAEAAAKAFTRGVDFAVVGADISRLAASTRLLCAEIRSSLQ